MNMCKIGLPCHYSLYVMAISITSIYTVLGIVKISQGYLKYMEYCTKAVSKYSIL